MDLCTSEVATWCSQPIKKMGTTHGKANRICGAASLGEMNMIIAVVIVPTRVIFSFSLVTGKATFEISQAGTATAA